MKIGDRVHVKGFVDEIRQDIIIIHNEGGYFGTVESEIVTEDRPTGKWEQISPAKIYECSECHQEVMTDDIEVYHYCHHCGADMREKETWHTSKGNIEMPKGLFNKIYNDEGE